MGGEARKRDLHEELDEDEDDEHSRAADNRLFGEIDTDLPTPNKVESQPLQLAMAGDNGPNPFVVKPAEKPPEKPPAEKPVEPTPPAPPETPKPPETRPAATDKAAQPGAPVTDNLLTQVPEASRDAAQRALQLLSKVQPGQPMSPETRRAFEQAITDADRIDPKWAAEREQQLTTEVETRSRKLPSGLVLPPWTRENETQMWETLGKADQAFRKLPADVGARIAQIEDRMKSLPATDVVGRTQLQQALQAEGRNDTSGNVNAYLAQKMSVDKFLADNALGLVRRNLHQQEMGLLHSSALTKGVYALALDKAGQPQDKANIEKLMKPVVGDQFAMTNFPDFKQLKEKFKIKEEDSLEEKIPGRAALRQAIDIMSDERQGTMAERMKKAAPLFEQAVGASDQIDTKKTNEQLEKIAEEASKLDKEKDKQRLDELDAKAVELLETARQPGLSRLTYALWMNNTAVETKDSAMRERAVTMLRSIEKGDSGARFDPLIQGAIKLAGSETPQVITPEKATEAGKPEVERIKKEDEDARKPPAELPFWRKALAVGGEAALGLGAMYALSYAFKPIFAAKNYLARSWEANRRINSVEVAPAEGAAPGSAPKLYLRDASGVERQVEGARMEDGKLRVRNGENLEIVKPTSKDKLILRVPPGTNLSPEEVRENARKVLAPTSVELQLQESQRQMQQLLEKQQKEIERLRTEAEARQSGSDTAPNPRRSPGDRIALNESPFATRVAADLNSLDTAVIGLRTDAKNLDKQHAHLAESIPRLAANNPALTNLVLDIPSNLQPHVRDYIHGKINGEQFEKLTGMTGDHSLRKVVDAVRQTNAGRGADAQLEIHAVGSEAPKYTGQPTENGKLGKSAGQAFVEIEKNPASKTLFVADRDAHVSAAQELAAELSRTSNREVTVEEVGKTGYLKVKDMPRAEEIAYADAHRAAAGKPPAPDQRKPVEVLPSTSNHADTLARENLGTVAVAPDETIADVLHYLAQTDPEFARRLEAERLTTGPGRDGQGQFDNNSLGTARENAPRTESTLGHLRLQPDKFGALNYRQALHELVGHRGFDNFMNGSPERRAVQAAIEQDYRSRGFDRDVLRTESGYKEYLRTPQELAAERIANEGVVKKLEARTQELTRQGQTVPPELAAELERQTKYQQELEKHIKEIRPTDATLAKQYDQYFEAMREYMKETFEKPFAEQIRFNRSAAPRGNTEVRQLDAKFDPAHPKGYFELHFEGKPEGARYFMDANTKEVFAYNEVELPGGEKVKTMTSAHEVEIRSHAAATSQTEHRSTSVPSELIAARGGASGSVDLLEIDRVTGRLKKTRTGLAEGIPHIGELNERSLDTLMRGWEKDIDEEIEKLKNDSTKDKERAELVKQKEALAGVRGELAAGGERATRVVEHFRRSSQSGAEIAEVPGNVGRWRGRVAVGGGAVLSVAILVGAGLGYYNRVVAPEQRRPPSTSLPPLSK